MLPSPAACSLPRLFTPAQAVSRAGLQGLVSRGWRCYRALCHSCSPRAAAAPTRPETRRPHALMQSGSAYHGVRHGGASLEGDHLVHHLDGSGGGLWCRPCLSVSREASTSLPLPLSVQGLAQHAASTPPHPCWHPSTTARALALGSVPRGPQDHMSAETLLPRSCRDHAESLPRACRDPAEILLSVRQDVQDIVCTGCAGPSALRALPPRPPVRSGPVQSSPVQSSPVQPSPGSG